MCAYGKTTLKREPKNQNSGAKARFNYELYALSASISDKKVKSIMPRENPIEERRFSLFNHSTAPPIPTRHPCPRSTYAMPSPHVATRCVGTDFLHNNGKRMSESITYERDDSGIMKQTTNTLSSSDQYPVPK